ncbi:MAG TPA: site-2 protease family protein, partial [Actinomycetota bacterium]|nr:site-2 protease family protein [Actinomycetota bacterium]
FSPSGLVRIGELVTGQAERSVEDPLSIVGAGRLAGQAASSENYDILLAFLAALNVFVGIVNILPLPPLDGGHLAVLAWEKVTGRKVDMAKLIPLTAAVAGLLILLTLALAYLDVANPVPDPFR